MLPCGSFCAWGLGVGRGWDGVTYGMGRLLFRQVLIGLRRPSWRMVTAAGCRERGDFLPGMCRIQVADRDLRPDPAMARAPAVTGQGAGLRCLLVRWVAGAP